MLTQPVPHRLQRRFGWLLLATGIGCCQKSPPLDTSGQTPDIQLQGITMRQYRGSAVELTARAPSAEVDRHKGDLIAHRATIELHHEQLKVKANRVVGNAWANWMTGTDGVTFASADGLTGSSPTVTYDRQNEGGARAHSDAGVEINNEGIRLTANTFVFDLATKQGTFTQAVTTIDSEALSAKRSR